ncbi:MAG: hypothetical protein EBZ55_06335 [Actinobacteria bacterium]|nr:hypothetical protein [Actinomycetota bacterium]
MQKPLKVVIAASFTTLLLVCAPEGVSASSLGGKCTKAGSLGGTATKPLICKKVGGRLIWQSISTGKSPSTSASSPKETVSQSNARRSAQGYLKVMAFSRTGLIKQLEFEGYSTADATYGTDSQNADWNAQAAKMAKTYLSTMPFSRSGLIDQLVFEGFSQAQAEFGVSANGL